MTTTHALRSALTTTKQSAPTWAPSLVGRHPDNTRGLNVSIDGASKRFGHRLVLRDLQLDIAAGEFVALVGRSGCGKSTLLRLLAGLEEPNAGGVRIGGEPARAGHPHVRMMFQEARLLPWKRVLDNVTLGLREADAASRGAEALAQVGLAERARDWPAVLSGGQRQRVALARALVHRPRMLLLDEPLGALDALTRMEMHLLLERLWREHGFTAVLVTHDVTEAVALADRVLLIEDHGIGLDQQVPLQRPRSRVDAGFAALEECVLKRVLAQPQTDMAQEPPPSGVRAWRWAV